MNRKKLFGLVMCGAMLLASTSVFTSCKDYNDDINDLQSQIDGLNTDLSAKITALQTAMSAAQAAITQAQADIVKAQKAADAAQTAADEAAEAAAAADLKAGLAAEAAAQAKIDAIAAAQKLVDDLKAELIAQIDTKVDQEVYKTKMAEIDGAITAINGSLEQIQKALGFDSETGAFAVLNLFEQQIATLNIFKTSIDELNLTNTYPTLLEDVATLQEEVKALQADMDPLKLRVDSLVKAVRNNDDDIQNLQNALAAFQKEVVDVLLPALEKELSAQISAIDEKLNLLIQQRLTSLVFVPSTYVNGIPAVAFTTLSYQAWTIDETTKLPVAPAADAAYSTKNASVTASYYVNPSSVDKDGIQGLLVDLIDGTNIITRADGADDATPSLSVSDYVIANGVMTVTFAKEGTFATTTTGDETVVEKFSQFAIQAELTPMGDEETSPVVTSEYARILDSMADPKIYNTTDPLTPTDGEYFYSYAQLTAGLPSAFCVAQLPYNVSFDLNTVAGVMGSIAPLDMEEYGLTFAFSSVGTGKTSTIGTDGSIIASSAASVAKYDSIQVLLMDGENIVDAKYFTIQWTAGELADVIDLGTFNVEFESGNRCDTVFSDTVSIATLTEKIYDVLGVSAATFAANYDLKNLLGTTPDSAYASTTSAIAAVTKDTLGSFKYATYTPATSKTLVWNFGLANSPLTNAELTAGTATRTAYGALVSSIDGTEVAFSVTLSIEIGQMSLAGGYLSTYWENAPLATTNENKVRVVNPTMTGDLTYGNTNFYSTQILASLLAGYSVTGATAPIDLVDGALDAKFIFDGGRLSDMTNLDANWSVNADADTLFYNYPAVGTTTPAKTVAAAAISAAGVISLIEDPEASETVPGTPTDAAIKLLALPTNNVPVKLVAGFCSVDGTVDQFLVRFIKPLTMTVATPANTTFTDLLQAGSTIDVSKLVTITGFAGTGVVLSNGVTTGATEVLQKWFNVTEVIWDLDNAITNLVKLPNGNIEPSTSTDYADWSNWADVKQQYDFTAVDATVGNIKMTQTLEFINYSGNALTESFKVAIPVVATTKWNPNLMSAVNGGYIEFTIQPGDISNN